MNPSDDPSAGVTLIELLIVIALLAILSGFFIPQFTSFPQRQELKTTTKEVATLIEEARSKAMSGLQGGAQSAVGYGVPVSSPDGIYRKYTSGSWESTYLKKFGIPTDMRASWPATDILFKIPTGKLDSTSDLTVRLCYDGIGEYHVIVRTTGVVEIEEQSGATCSF